MGGEGASGIMLSHFICHTPEVFHSGERLIVEGLGAWRECVVVGVAGCYLTGPGDSADAWSIVVSEGDAG